MTERNGRPVVYIAGPITRGNRVHNLNQAEDAMRRLLEAGFSVICPQLTLRVPWAFEVPWEVWLESALPQVERSHALLLLSGESRGAEREVQHATKHNIPVYQETQEALLIADRDRLAGKTIVIRRVRILVCEDTTGYSAYALFLPVGCWAPTEEGAMQRIEARVRETIEGHEKNGEPVPWTSEPCNLPRPEGSYERWVLLLPP